MRRGTSVASRTLGVKSTVWRLIFNARGRNVVVGDVVGLDIGGLFISEIITEESIVGKEREGEGGVT